MGDAAVTYSLKYQARVLTSLPSDSVNSKWIVGTTALREENEVCSEPMHAFVKRGGRKSFVQLTRLRC